MPTVLVVIHNRSELRGITDSLQGAGYEVIPATDGLQGFNLFKEKQPDAVVIDLLIPKLPGGELCQRIKEDQHGADIPVVLISSLFKKTDMKKRAVQNWHADHFLPWPFEIEDLIKIFSNLPKAEKKTAPVREDEGQPEKAVVAEKETEQGKDASLEELLAKTLAELEGSSLIDRSPKVAQIDEEIKAHKADQAEDKISELLDEVADQVLVELKEEGDFQPEETPPERPDEMEEAEIALEGELDEVSIPELFANIFFAQKTGILEIQHKGVVKNIYFQQGRAVYVESEGRQESLGQIMVRQGLISNNDVLLSLENMAAYGRRQGDALVEIGRINPMQLYQALRLQMREKLLGLFQWFKGSYYFDMTPFDINSITAFEVRMPEVILQGILEAYDAGGIQEMFAEVVDQLIVPATPLPFSRQESDLPAEIWPLFSLVDGRRTIAEVVAASPVRQEKTYLLLYAMLVLRMFDRPRDEEAHEEETSIIAEDEQIEFLQPIDEEIVIEETHTKTDRLKPIDGGGETETPGGLIDQSATTIDERPVSVSEEIERELAKFAEGKDEEKLVQIDHEKDNAEELKEEILSRYLKLGHGNHYQILGVEQDVKDITIENVYQEFTQRFREEKTDRLLDEETAEKARAVRKAVDEAYAVISLPIKRSEYDNRLTPEGEELKERRITTILAAERAFNQGMLALRRQGYAQAEKQFAQACELFPEEAEYHAYLGWARWNNSKAAKQDRSILAKESLERSLKINPKGDKAYLFLGKILLAHDNKEKARKLFALALRHNKNNEDAKAELVKLQHEIERKRAEIQALKKGENVSGLLKKDIDFQAVKKAIRKMFW